jgi:DNA-binding PadR family transcriptional regulator
MVSKILKNVQRRLIKHFLDTIILDKLKNTQALSGYDIMELVHKKFGLLISSGTVYALLYSMERKGLIRGELTGGKRIYALSDKGIDTINTILKSKEEIQRFIGTLF